MAMNYQNFASLGVNLNRQKYGPLDISNVFTSAADLKYYLTKGTFTEGVSEYWYKNANEKIVPYPYEGQVLATVIDGVVEVFVLALDAEGNFETREIAGKIEVDGKTIVKDAEGKLSVVAPVNPDEKKTYNFSYANGVYSWVEVDTATAAGQAQAIQNLTDRTVALENTVNGTGEGEEHVAGLVEKVAALEAVDNATQAELDAYKEVVTAAIAAGVAEAKKYADDNDTDTVYDDSALAARVKAIEDDYLKEEDKYDDTALAARVKAIEDDYLTESDKYDDTELKNKVSTLETNLGTEITNRETAVSDALNSAKTYTDTAINGLDVAIVKDESKVTKIIITNTAGDVVADVDASVFVQDSVLNDVKYDAATRKITFEWLMADGSAKTDEVDIADLVDTYTAGTGLTLTANEFSVDFTKVASVESLNELAQAAQTAEEVEAAIDAKITAANLGQYAIKNDVETALGTKLDKTTYEDDQAQYVADKATFALKSDVETGLAGKVDNSTLEDYYTKAEVDDKGYAVATEVAATYATKTELTEAVEGIENDLLAYAKTADVNAELAKKIETGSIAHSSETLAEGVTVEGTKLNIVVDAYTKQEVRDYVADAIETMTGGESAADVLLALNNHIATYEEKVGQLDAKDATHDTAIAAAQTQADKGVADAAKVATDLAALDARVVSNGNEINAVKGTISTVNETLGGKITALETAKGEQAGQITALGNRLTTAESGITTNSTDINTIKGQITALGNEDTRLAGLIDGLSTSKANAADVYTKTDADAAISAAITAELVDVNAAIAGKADTSVVNAALDLKANAADVYAKADVYTKDEADAEFMTQDEVDARINALIVAADPEGGKTITDIQNLVKYVDENAGEIAELITATGANTTKLAGIDTTVTDYVTSAIGAIIMPKASTEITIAEDGTLGIGEVNVNKLVQDEDDVLILDGGSAL